MKKLLLVALLLSLSGCIEPDNEPDLEKLRADTCYIMLDDMYEVARGYQETVQGYHELINEQAVALAEVQRENIMLREIILENLPQEKKSKEQLKYSMSMLGMEINTWKK